MKLETLFEAKYVGSEPIEEFYGLYDLEKKRFVKPHQRDQQKILQRAASIRTTVLFNSKESC